MLEAPDWEACDTLRRHRLPFVLWPVCGKPLLAHWLDAVLAEGAGAIRIHATDRPHLVRAWIAKGDYWSKPVEVLGTAAPVGARVMDSFPGAPDPTPVTNGAGVLARWFSCHAAAVERLGRSELAIDREIAPGVWVAPGAEIHPSAKLTAPCWIGPRASVGPGCRLGPGAYIGRQAVLDEDVEVEGAIVCDHTFVGRHTRLAGSAAEGGLLLDWARGVRVEIPEDFILGDLAARTAAPGWTDRSVAAALAFVLALPAWLLNLGERPTRKTVQLARGGDIVLTTRSRGPLLIRRQAWLRHVIAGRLHLWGILPRSAAEWDALAPGVRGVLESAPVGILSLADLHGAHDAADADEWIHAVYQAGSTAPRCASFWKAAFLTPLA